MDHLSPDSSGAGDPVTYLDYGASAPLRPEVAAAMAEVYAVPLGNPTGSHPPAQRARRLLEEARDEVAQHLGRTPGEIVFTSGGTESANLAVFGALGSLDSLGASADEPPSIVCSAIEHPAVLESCRAAARQLHAELCTLGVHPSGVVDVAGLPELLSERTRLVAVMVANNETGVIQPLADVVEVVRQHAGPVWVLADAVQAAPFMDLTLATGGADLVAVSAHKLGGPVGTGALAVSPRVGLAPLLHGGGQERERRSGTQDVAGAVGLASALRLATAERGEAATRVASQRDRLASGLVEAIPDAHRTVPHGVVTLPGHLHLCLPGIEREELLVALGARGVCVSGGSSCASGALESSHVLAAMGVPDELARGAVRFTLGHGTTDAEVDRALAVVPAVVAGLRQPA